MNDFQAIKQVAYYTIQDKVNKRGKGYAIIRDGSMVVEKFYKTSMNAYKTCEKMNNQCLDTIKRVSWINRYNVNDNQKWHVVEFTVNDIISAF